METFRKSELSKVSSLSLSERQSHPILKSREINMNETNLRHEHSVADFSNKSNRALMLRSPMDSEVVDSTLRESEDSDEGKTTSVTCIPWFKLIRKLQSKITGSRNGNSSSEVSSPLLFSSVHGENVQLFQEGTVARRTNSFCKAIVFSNRTIKVNEKINVKFIDVSSSWSGVLRFGFTSHSPNSLRNSLPRFACPDLTSRPGFWAKAFNDSLVKQNTIMHYYVTPAGDVHFGLNGEEHGVFFTGVDTSKDLWCLLDIYGNSTAIEFVDPPANVRTIFSSNMQLPSNSLEETVFGARKTNGANHYVGVARNSIHFHRTKGKRVVLNGSSTIAWRPPTSNELEGGYLFTSRPINLGETVVIQFQKNNNLAPISLSFGITSCDPKTILASALPNDPLSLMDRREYWVVVQDAIKRGCRDGDEFGFTILSSGAVTMSRNGHSPPSVLVHVDTSVPLWAFFDMRGHHKISIIGSIPSDFRQVGEVAEGRTQRMLLGVSNSISRDTPSASAQRTRPSGSSCPGSRPSLYGKNVDGLLAKSMDSSKSPSKESPVATSPQEPSNWSLECVICCERTVDSAFYTCGHMCMCFECATSYWKNKDARFCPICRAAIVDVIRTYRS